LPDEEELEVLSQVRQEVNKAIELRQQRHAGANLDEAGTFLKQAREAITKNDFKEVLRLAQKAQLAARPTTEYLLDKAKKLEGNGSEAYKKEKFPQAIELWQKSLEEYSRARELAIERKEEEIVKALEPTMASIKEDIKGAEREKANKDMVAFGEQANKSVDEAKSEFEAGQFDAAREKFESARDLYAKGAAIARDFGFEDEPGIRAAIEEMGVSIEACLLSKGEALIEAASKEKDSKKKEDAFSKVIKYLESFSSETKKHEELKGRACEGLASARIEIGTKLMEDAEALLTRNEHYRAKEGYRNAQKYFNELSDFTVEHRLEKKKEEVDRWIEDCTVNIKLCTDSMLGREKVVGGKVRKVGELRKGIRVPIKPDLLPEEMIEKIRKLQAEYESITHLGTGGFGEVYQAKNRDGAVIAIKVLSRIDTRSEDIFFRELKVWQDLVHANIVRLIRPRFTPTPLFEMEYVDGGDLAGLLEGNKPLPRDRACRIASDIARGLYYAHLHNVVHADLKPENILLKKTGEAKITDWGLGRIATSSSRGRGYTPGYAAPEQVEKGIAGKKSDVYQLGLLFYEMLTGDNPFTHGSLEERDDKVLKYTPEKPSAVNPELEPLDDIVMRCLEKNPDSRPSIREFREAIHKYMEEYLTIRLPALTLEQRTQIETLCDNALLEAKVKNYQGCIAALGDLVSKLGDREKREGVRSLISRMKYRQEEGMEIQDEVLTELNGVLRWIECGEP